MSILDLWKPTVSTIQDIEPDLTGGRGRGGQIQVWQHIWHYPPRLQHAGDSRGLTRVGTREKSFPNILPVPVPTLRIISISAKSKISYYRHNFASTKINFCENKKKSFFVPTLDMTVCGGGGVGLTPGMMKEASQQPRTSAKRLRVPIVLWKMGFLVKVRYR